MTGLFEVAGTGDGRFESSEKIVPTAQFLGINETERFVPGICEFKFRFGFCLFDAARPLTIGEVD